MVTWLKIPKCMTFRFYKMASSFDGCHFVMLSARSHADCYALSFKLGSTSHSFPRLNCLLREGKGISCGKYHSTPQHPTFQILWLSVGIQLLSYVWMFKKCCPSATHFCSGVINISLLTRLYVEVERRKRNTLKAIWKRGAGVIWLTVDKLLFGML